MTEPAPKIEIRDKTRPQAGATEADYIGFLGYFQRYLMTVGFPVVSAQCPSCRGTWRVWKKLCPTSEDYACGYRTIWKCDDRDCGEMEVR